MRASSSCSGVEVEVDETLGRVVEPVPDLGRGRERSEASSLPVAPLLLHPVISMEGGH